MNNIDILFVSHRHDVAGGAEKALIEMLEYLKTLGLRMYVVIGSEGNITQDLVRLDIPYSVIYQPYWAHSQEDPSLFHFKSLNPAFNTTLQLVDLINRLKPKLCVTNTIVIPWMGYACSLTGTPHAWMIHELGTVGLNLRYAIGEDQTLRSIDALSDAIFFNSQYTEKYYLPHISKSTKRGIVYPGGNIPQPQKIQSPYTKQAFKLVAVAQIKPQKGQFDAVRAVKELRDRGHNVELILIGLREDGKYVKHIQSFINRHRLQDYIKILGHKKNPSSYVSLADAALVSSTNDAFGRVTVEAMMLAKPVIAAASAGTLEVIADQKTGLLYEPGNWQDMADKIEYIIKNPAKAKKISTAAQTNATQLYCDKNRFSSFVDYYKNLPDNKTALDLSPLGSAFVDFAATVNLLKDRESRLKHVETSKIWRLGRMIKKVLKP